VCFYRNAAEQRQLYAAEKFGSFRFVRMVFTEWMRGRRIGVTTEVWIIWYALLLGGLLLAVIHLRKERKEV